MDNVTYEPEHMTLTAPAKSFLDLPGEIRNKIYHYHLINWIPDDRSTALTSVCRQMRFECRPLNSAQTVVAVPLYKLERFFKTFFPYETPAAMSTCSCQVKIDLEWENGENVDVVDMHWLLIFLIDFPNISVAFNGNDEFDQEGHDLGKLIDIARSTPGWRDHAAGFHSIKLVAKFWSFFGTCSSRLKLSLDIVKHDVGQQWRDKHELFPRHIEKLKADLGLILGIPARLDVPARWRSSPFLRLRTEVYKHSTYPADAHGWLDSEGLWRAGWKPARP